MTLIDVADLARLLAGDAPPPPLEPHVVSRLVAATPDAGKVVLDAARDEGLAVLPYCPFTAGYIRNHRDDYVDLVPEDKRAKFGL